MAHGVTCFVVYANSLVWKFLLLYFVLFGSIKLLGQIISLFTISEYLIMAVRCSSYIFMCEKALPSLKTEFFLSSLFLPLAFKVQFLFSVHDYKDSSVGKVVKQTSCILKNCFSLAQVHIPNIKLPRDL